MLLVGGRPLREVIQRSLAEAGPWWTGPADEALVARLLAAIDAGVTQPSQLEASVRWSGGAHRGSRMMLEAVPASVVEASAVALGVALPPLARTLGEIAAAEGLPLIGGWDIAPGRDGRTPGARLVKLYLNASDASAPLRRSLPARAGLPPPPPAAAAPHLIGINARGDGRSETKVYVQGQDERALAGLCDEGASTDRATRLAGAALAQGASAGAVVSWDVEAALDRGPAGAYRLRAFFIATHGGDDAAIERFATGLPGWDAGAVRAGMPFDPGSVRSVGIALTGPEATTVYCKPRGSQQPVSSLDPAARFRAGPAEVGLFVEPNALAERAYARTAHHALSYRSREGTAPRVSIEALMAWALDRVRAAEATGLPPARLLSEPPGPPHPWRLVVD